ncbi:hypothetical protein J7399_09000 [Shimia sp. R9_1]|uniref:hypothetical protein n=1 Tax=Shimia sp. R9_1 TaxID=2821111 RepID=UPI001ADC8EFC|nr:hypothetical protein [Shimia sp. R9_1]MBO9407563.1 hypothetical protein [Shimia sp. R9_1]
MKGVSIFLLVVAVFCTSVFFRAEDWGERKDLQQALEVSESLSEFKAWAGSAGFFPNACGYDEISGVWALPCGLVPKEWMLREGDDVHCVTKPLNGLGDLADEFLAAFILADQTEVLEYAIAHVDQRWPAGTWDGLLLREDFGEKRWCEFKPAGDA